MRHRIGLIADVQFADIDDAWDFHRSFKRRYRATKRALHNAVSTWRNANIDLVVDLGDAIDGCKNSTKSMGINALLQIVDEWNQLPKHIPILHLIGNHELYQFSRDELRNGVAKTGFRCIPPSIINSPWRVVVLDPYEISVMSGGGGRINIELTLENGGLDFESFNLCQRNNPNDILDGGDYFRGVSGVESRWAPFNGGLGDHQLIWLETTLLKSRNNHEKVIVFSHVILHPHATPDRDCRTLLWNYDSVLSLFAKYNCVRLVIAGHAHHEGYYYCPSTKVHHVSLVSPLEAPHHLTEETFATLEISDCDNFGKLVGNGWVRSMEFEFH